MIFYPTSQYPANKISHSEPCSKCWKAINYLDIKKEEKALPVLVPVDLAPRDDEWTPHICRTKQ